MDNLRAFDDSVEIGFPRDDEPAIEAPPEIGSDERRMHVRAYNYWVSLLGGRAYPSIADLEPHDLDDFGPYSVLLDFSASCDDPGVAFVGRAVRAECGITGDIRTIADVPSRSLLSRLTDHYLQIIANRAPIGFEAEFINHRGYNTMYRGILMPLSSDGKAIDFIYGVINWKEVAAPDLAERIAREVERVSAAPAAEANLVWADGPNSEPLQMPAGAVAPAFDEDQHLLGIDIDPDAGLADRLCAARNAAEAARNADARSRSALYRALGHAYDFALAAEEAPDDYAELLDDAGLKAQERAPMTPVVKLVFGADYDKTRLTEFAAALSHARRQDLGKGELASYLERTAGGLKAVVAAERQARRPADRPDRSAHIRATLRHRDPIAYLNLPGAGGEFVLLVARQEADGRLAIVAPVAADEPLLDRALRKSIG